MNDLQKLYDVLKRDGYYTKSFEEFKVKWQDQAYKDKVYSVVSRDGLYTKSKDEFLTKYSGQQEPLKKKEFTASASNLGKPTSGSSSRWDDVTEEPISQKKVRTEDYLDKVQNAQRKAKAPTQKVESTFEQPKETKPPVKFDVLSEKEAMQMMAEDFGKKEFEAYSSIEKIPSANKLKDLDEETTANILNKQFEGTNLEFKKLGWQLTVTSKIGDGINSTVLNEKTIDLSDPNADKQLKSFVSNNLVKKSEREQFENAQSVEDLVELVGSNPNKFKASLLEGMDVEKYFERERQLLNGEMARAKADTYDSDLKSYEQKVVKFNQDVKGGKMSKADFDARSNALETERKALMKRRDIMSSVIGKAEKIDSLTKNLEKANVITTAEREKQGSLTGLVLRGIGEGLTDVSQAMIDFGIAGVSAVSDAKTLADAITPGEYERLKRLGFSDDQIKNEIQKSVKNKANQVLRSVPDAFGLGTTEEYAKSADRGIIEQAAYALGESLGAVGGGVATAGTNAGFFAMSYNALEDQMRGPQFDALTENEKKIMSVPYGLVIGALEKLGAKVATTAAKNKTLGMFSEYIMAKTFSSLPKNASLLEIKSAIDKSIAASVANGMIKITGAGIVEGGTEFTQQIFEGIEKDVANRIIQSNQLEAAKEEGGGTVSKEIYDKIVENKFFKDAADLTTSEGIQQLLKESGNAFLVGAVAGGMGGTMSVGIAEPISNKISNNKFAVYRDIILNDDAREGAISSINKKVEDNELTREEADQQIKSINESYPALRQIPSSFSLSSQREAFGLLREKDQLQKEIDGKDPSLVAKQKDRIAEIETQLKGLSYAVQEQSTDAIPVQPTTGVGGEMAQGAPETGLKETAQKGQEEVDQYIADMGAEARIGSVINPIMDKMANAEYINDNDIDNAITTIFNEVEQLEKSDKYSPETKAAISDKLLNIAEKLDNYEFRTKTETVEVTKAGAATATRKTSEAVRKIRAEKYFNAVQATVNGQEVTLQDKNGRVEAPMPNGEVIVLDTPSMEIAEGGFEFDENDALVSVTVNDRLGNTVKLTGDQALDFAIRDRENKLGVVEQAEFDEAYQEVETRYVKEAKPAEAPVAEAAVVAEAEPTAEPVATEAVIGDIEVTEVPAVEETMDEIDRLNNILTAEDFNEVNLSDKKTNKVAAQITKAAKAISKVLPKVKFVVHSTPEAFVEATKSLDGRASEGGIYDHNTKTIHINLKNANSRTVAHEVFHALILSKVASDAEASRLTRSMIKAVIKSLKQAEGGADIISFLEDFEKDYEANIQNEEKLSELFAILSDNYKKLPPATKNIIVRFLERMAKLVGIKPMTSGEVIQFMNVLSAKVEAGEVITEQEIGEQQQAGKTKTRKQIIGEKGAERLDAMESNTRRMSNLVMAKNMTDDGKSPLEIRVATGWELGSDGKWRYETVDNIPYLKDTVKQVNEFLADNKDADSIEQKAYFFLPPELIKMYPELNDITIEFGRGNEKEGSYSPLLKLIRVNVGVYPKNTVSVLLHEVQHAIQEIEGFDSGASMDRLMTKFVDREKGLSYRIKRLKGRGGNEALLEKAINDYREFVANFAIENNGKKILNAFNLYNRKSGEVEARNVQDRMNMTEEERRKTLLSETAEVKKPQQIFSENMFQPRKQKINALSEKSKKIIKSNYEDSFGFNDFDWNKESNRKDFSQWLKTFEENQFKKNLPKVIKEVESDIELLKKRKIVELKLKGFEELIIPTLGNEVLVPELSLYEESILMNPSATIESLEKGFKEAKNIIDEDGSINKYKTTPSNLFKGDDISLPNFERFIQKNPEYTGVFNDWKKIFDEDIELTLKNTYAFRYPNLEQLEYLHKELKEIQKNEQEFAPRKQKIKTTIDEFDGETTVTLDGKKIGKMFYDRSQRAWVNAEFDKTSSKPYTSKWIYGDVLGDTKAEAINELIKRNSEEKAEAKVEKPKKVTQYTEDQIINEFLTALNDKGNIQRSPIGKEFIYGDKAFLEFSRFDKETGAREISLQSIASIDKGQGAGKEVMKDITDTADELGITLTLDAKPFGDTGLSKKALINFYEKNGFVPDLEEAFGGEFETEEELIDYVLENEREALPMVRMPKQEFAPRKQKLAPNGKPSNLNDQQWEQVRTPEFKAWFGDWENNPENASKVVDENGEPLVVSHFTDQKFDVFKYKEGGFHFGDASLKDDLEIAKGKSLPIELKVFLNIKSPLRIEDSPRFFAEDILKQLERESEYLLTDETIDNLYDKFIDIDESDFEDPETKKSNELIKEVEKLGIDGYIYENQFDSQDSKSSYLVDEENSKIYMRNDGSVYVGNVKKLEGSNARPFLTFTSKSGTEYYAEKNEADEINDSDKNRIKELLDQGNIIYTINSPRTYSDFDLFTGPQQFNDSYIAFQPNQIKSATENVGTFSEKEFSIRKQKNSVDRLVNEGKEQGKTDQEIRQDATAAGFTQKEISSALAKYYAKGEGIFTRSGKTGVTTRLYEGAKKLAQQYLTSKGLMPKIGFNLKERMEGEISKEANRAVNTAKKFGKLFDKYKGDKEALLEAFDKYIRGEKRVKLPAKFVGIANEMRNHIDTLSQMLINNGAVTGEMADTIQQNLGSYLSRSYEIYDNKNWKKKVGDQLVNQARNFLRTQPGTIAQAQADATAQNIPFNEALDNLVDNKIEDLFAEVQTEGFFKGSKVGAKDLSTLKFRQDIPEQIRMLMGEYTDPAMNYARTVNKLIHLAAQHKFLSDMREAGLGKFFFEKNDSLRPIGYNTQIAAKGSEVMAPLNGLYTTPEIFEAFQKQFNQKEIGAVMTFLYRVMGITKWLKTIASAATHMKNVFSNIGFVMANGHNILKLGPAIKVVANDLRTMSKPEVQAKIDEYIEAGIMRQGAGINEIRDMFKDANLDRFLEKRLSLKQPKGLMSKVKRAIGAPFIGFKTIAEALYQAEDDMFKIAAYENEVARYANSWYNKKPADLTEAERKIVVDKAADNVKNTYPTYSRIPEGIKQLRKFPLFIGSFISFQAESYRTAFNTIALAKEELLSGNKKLRTIGASRIAGASAYLTIKNAILSHFGMALGTGLSGVIGALYDDDDEKKKEEDVREFLPPWSKDSDIIPIKKSDGTIEYIDFSASDPHGALNKALNAFFRGDDLLDSFSKGLLATVEPFVGPDITVGLAMQLANNENDFGGKIYNEEDTFAEKTRKIADFVYKVIEPGTITSVRKVWKDEQPLMNSLFGEATGMKIRPLEVKKQFEFKMDTYADEFAEIKRIYKSEYNKTLRMMEDPKVSKKELAEQEKKTEEAFNRANSLYAAKGKELMNLINAANRLGVDYDELIEAVKAKNVMNSTNLFEIQQDNPAQIEEKYY